MHSNDQEPGGINRTVNVADDHELEENFTNTNVTDADTHVEMGLMTMPS